MLIMFFYDFYYVSVIWISAATGVKKIECKHSQESKVRFRLKKHYYVDPDSTWCVP